MDCVKASGTASLLTGLVVGMAAMLDAPAYRHVSTRSRNDGLNTGHQAMSSLSIPGQWYDQTNANQLATGTVGGLAVSGPVPGTASASIRYAPTLSARRMGVAVRF